MNKRQAKQIKIGDRVVSKFTGFPYQIKGISESTEYPGHLNFRTTTGRNILSLDIMPRGHK